MWKERGPKVRPSSQAGRRSELEGILVQSATRGGLDLGYAIYKNPAFLEELEKMLTASILSSEAFYL